MRFYTISFILILAFLSYGCGNDLQDELNMVEGDLKVAENNENLKKAVFAGGCFWCSESDFEKINGVIEVVSGYTGGDEEDPTYKEVASGSTGHVEAIEILYDANVVDYKDLLEVFWRHINPTDDGGQFVDRGKQYRSAIFYGDSNQEELARESKEMLDNSGIYDKPIVTEILPLKEFYAAEDYHQDYHNKNPIRYKFYRGGSGRDDYINSIWTKENLEKYDEINGNEEEEEVSEFVKPSKEELKESLSELQFYVTQKNGTERPFTNEYHDSKEEGIYVDIVSGEPLFSSKDKFDSGTGWPSFTKPLEEENIVTNKDFKLIIPRTEVRSKDADSHLGHVFKDGPEPTGLRYCMNSAALRFVPKEKLEEEGYEEYLGEFE